ncbi:hypothetical protein B0J11DRAFT_576876 [Dendryphion nanum]|uniref:Xylanolytic transcriptional activator regulatory domain-containing protein n=1 Tax=Dendryphion nanum TaxID=256645 RepID=A0A9P9E7A4_9PLEO|nr:hypothetical protein B0J11DRAFT_576876 [Dendryphion nanum]
MAGKRKDAYIKELEDRMQKVEGFMQSSALQVEDRDAESGHDDRMEDVDTFPNTSPDLETPEVITTPLEPSHNLDIPQQTPSVLPNFLDVHRTTPDPSKTFPTDAQQPVRQIFASISLRGHLIHLADAYLVDINPSFPLFDRQSLLAAMNHHYPNPSTYTTCDPAWWAILNSIFAICMQRKAINSSFNKISEFAWNFFKNAWAVYGEIVARVQPTVLDVQALLVMAKFIETTTDGRTLAMITSSAVRLLQLIGLDSPELGSDEKKGRIFWCAYLMDKRAGIEIGLPSLLGGTNIDGRESMPLPPLQDDTDPMAKLFRLRVSLAIIDMKIRNVIDSKHCIDELLQNQRQGQIQDLLYDLESWRLSVPIESRPGHDIHIPAGSARFAFVLLMLSYYNSLSMLHGIRDAGHEDSTETSRLTLRLIGALDPALSFVDQWSALRHLFTAFFILLNSSISNPTSPTAPDNLEHMKTFVWFLENLHSNPSQNIPDFKVFLLALQGFLSLSQSIVLGGKSASGFLSNFPNVTDVMLLAQAHMALLPLGCESGVLARLERELELGMSEIGCSDLTLVAGFAPACLKPVTYGFGVRSAVGSARGEGALREGL